MTATTTTIKSTAPHRSRTHDLPARLRLKEVTVSRGLLDGAWWPRSRDLERELPALAALLDPMWDRITRVAVNPLHWEALPRKVAVAGHVIKVSWFTPELDAHKMLLLSYAVGRWDLLVIPPETGSAAAHRLTAAVTDGPPRTASALMADEESREKALEATETAGRDPGAAPASGSEEVWEDEGGASPGGLAVQAEPTVRHRPLAART
jgi:hypothetical protein